MSVCLHVITNVSSNIQHSKSPLTSGGIWDAKETGNTGNTAFTAKFLEGVLWLSSVIYALCWVLTYLEGLGINCILDYEVSYLKSVIVYPFFIIFCCLCSQHKMANLCWRKWCSHVPIVRRDRPISAYHKVILSMGSHCLTAIETAFVYLVILIKCAESLFPS